MIILSSNGLGRIDCAGSIALLNNKVLLADLMRTSILGNT
jgi:hypothetical protein